MRGGGVFGSVAVLCIFLLAACGPRGLPAIEREVRRQFPDVPTIRTAELADRLAVSRRAGGPVLIDVRSEEEYAVSHLPGAVRVEPGSGAEAISLPRDAEIVTYCSVGYRSAEFADRLRRAGYGNVRNLEGSIFRWANEGRPLAGRAGSAGLVHPYDALWGRYLEKARRAPAR